MSIGPGSFRRALIVEDDEQLRRSLTRLIRSWRVEIVQARSVEEGRELLKGPFDLVITDVRLPDGTGLMVADLASQCSPVPLIVAMSGVASAGEAFELAQHGVRVYLSKPFTPDDLKEKITEAQSTPDGTGGIPSIAEPTPMLPRSKVQLASDLEGFVERYRLTPRQESLVRMTIGGVPRSHYAELLGVTENTCKTMIRRLLHKCGARSLAEIPRLMLVESAGNDL